MKIFTTANVPDELGQAWLQHLRGFDVAHPGCHFEVGIDAPEHSLQEMVEMMRLKPALTFTKIFDRAQQPNSAPALLGSQNNAESDPSVMPDQAGAETPADSPQRRDGPTDAMVEAAAKAIVSASFADDEMPPWEDYKPHARAALIAAGLGHPQEAKER